MNHGTRPWWRKESESESIFSWQSTAPQRALRLRRPPKEWKKYPKCTRHLGWISATGRGLPSQEFSIQRQLLRRQVHHSAQLTQSERTCYFRENHDPTKG